MYAQSPNRAARSTSRAMPLTEREWQTLKQNVERFLRDVARDVDGVAREAQALLRVSQRDDVPRDVGLVLEVSADSVGQSLFRIERRMMLLRRDLEDLRSGGEW